jgi:tyrosyl-tRNA synthetase
MGRGGAEEAIKMSGALFSGDVASLSESEIVELLGSFKFKLDGPKNLVDLLIAVGAAPSKTQARTFIEQNSVSINGEKATDPAKVYGQAMPSSASTDHPPGQERTTISASSKRKERGFAGDIAAKPFYLVFFTLIW